MRWIAYQTINLLGFISSILWVLAPVVFILGVSGLGLRHGPIVSLMSVISGAFFLILLMALVLGVIIEAIILARSNLRQTWRIHTPPYTEHEISELPVLDKSKSKSISKFQRWVQISILVYVASVLVSIYIVLERPPIVLVVFEQELSQVVFLTVSVLFQIPGFVFGNPGLLEFLPPANTKWDAIVRFLLIAPTLIPALFTVENLRQWIFYKRRQFYESIYVSVIGESKPDANLKRKSTIYVLFGVIVDPMFLLFIYTVFRSV